MACRNLQLADMIAADAARTQARDELRARQKHSDKSANPAKPRQPKTTPENGVWDGFGRVFTP